MTNPLDFLREPAYPNQGYRDLAGGLPGYVEANGRAGEPPAGERPRPPSGWPPRSHAEFVAAHKAMLWSVLNDPALMTTLAQRVWQIGYRHHRPVSLPPWESMPYFGRYIGGSAIVGGVTLVNGGGFTDLVTGTVPEGHTGVLKWFAQRVPSAANWSGIGWRVMVGEDLRLGPLSVMLAEMNSPQEITIIVPENTTFRLQAANDSGADIDGVNGILLGWVWPIQMTGETPDAHTTVR